MSLFDFHKTIINTSGDYLKKLTAINPFSLHKKGTKTKAFFALALVCLAWGTTWLASKEGVKHMPALQLAGYRQLIGGSCYVAFFLYKKVPLPKGKEWFPVIVLAFLNFFLSNGLSTWGVQYISAGLGSIIGAIFPLWLVVIGFFASKEKIPAKAVIGLLFGFSGVCVIFFDHLIDFKNPDFRIGIILSIIATWSWAFGTVYTKKQALNFNPYFSLGLQMVISGATLSAFSSATGNSVPFVFLTWQSFAAIGYLVIVGSLLAFICYLYALQHLPTEQVSVYAYINPMVAVLFGWLFFSENVTVFIIIGGLITLLGVYLVNKAFKVVPAPEQPEAEGV